MHVHPESHSTHGPHHHGAKVGPSEDKGHSHGHPKTYLELTRGETSERVIEDLDAACRAKKEEQGPPPELPSRRKLALELPLDARQPGLAESLLPGITKHLAPSDSPPLERRDLNSLTNTELDDLVAAVKLLQEHGLYAELVAIHENMDYDMHTMMYEKFHDQITPKVNGAGDFMLSTSGLLRFLPWHRRFLRDFELLLNAAHNQLRGSGKGNAKGSSRMGLPYWNWTKALPTRLLEGLVPMKVPGAPGRSPGHTGVFTDRETVLEVLDGFRKQLVDFEDIDDYGRFTWTLEGWGTLPEGWKPLNGSNFLPAHNHGHAFIGGVMGMIMQSPADPIFWLHHCQVDRLWHLWQQKHPLERPVLEGEECRTLRPWKEDCDEVLEIAALNYEYDAPWDAWLADWLEEGDTSAVKFEA